MSNFERIVRFHPGFDRRDPDPSKNYGIGAVRISFLLKGDLGAVQWMIGTDWFPASAASSGSLRGEGRPTGWDLGYHSKKPQYEGQSEMASCDLFDGPCFYDGSGLNADLLIENFIRHGDEYVWLALEAYYPCALDNAPWPFDKAGNVVTIPAPMANGEREGGK